MLVATASKSGAPDLAFKGSVMVWDKDQPFDGGPRHERRVDMLSAYEHDGVMPPLP